MCASPHPTEEAAASRPASPAASSDSSDGGGAVHAPSTPLVRPSSSTTSKRAYTTEVVKALFGGDSVGDVVEDFFCSFQRQSGRMYVSTTGLFFYSNLFGFERKIRINYDQALDIQKIRTTSLSVTTVQGDEVVFRSFDNREHVLDIILSYHSNEGGMSNAVVSEEEAKPVTVDKSSEKTIKFDSTRNDASTLVDLSNKIPSPLGHSHNIERRQKAYDSDNACERKETNTNMGVDSVAIDPTESVNCEAENNATHLENMIQHTKEWESVVTNLKLPCKSVEEFFDSFLADDAANSLKLFHANLGDKNVAVKAWEATYGFKSLSRTIQFEHNKSGAKVTREQTYHAGSDRAYLKNVTKVKGRGIPDVFFVEDAWFIVLGQNGNGVVLNVKFHVNFTKGTMLRSIIEGRAKAESRESYRLYSAFTRRGLRVQVPEQEETIIPDVVTAEVTEVGRPTSFLDWFGFLASLAQEHVPHLSKYMPTSFERWKTQLTALMQGEVATIFTEWYRFLVSSTPHSVKNFSVGPQNGPILFILIFSSIIIYRLKLRVTALEEIVGGIEQRLLEFEKARIHVQQFTSELP